MRWTFNDGFGARGGRACTCSLTMCLRTRLGSFCRRSGTESSRLRIRHGGYTVLVGSVTVPTRIIICARTLLTGGNCRGRFTGRTSD